ncbi:MAG TPA: aminoacetone oxidase family FAD-binding enzyme, partial [Thermoanaerobaculia bacterium]|nr:aminoacetone oxidase family FAD-binding enzyme [Thermoanaerobaculia bacterium]
MSNYDLAIIGAGAAGLMAAISAGRAARERGVPSRIAAIDSAKKIGAKILISGGGRCNITNEVVRAQDFNGMQNGIAKVLRTFGVADTVAFFEDLGVPLKREETGKIFPISNRARDVVDALLAAAEEAGVEIVSGMPVISIEPGFVVNGSIRADRVILAAGGRSVPKTGSDGSGYALARALGHTVTNTFPALVPLIVTPGHWITSISGTSVDAELSVKSPTGRVLHRHHGSMLFTHFGLSGPVVLDISRHWIANQPATLFANFLPGETFDSLEAMLLEAARGNPRSTVASVLRGRLPERLLTQLTPDTPLGKMTKEDRRRIVRDLVDSALPVIRDRGFDYAEVTAGGVPLEEIDLSTMESRRCKNLYLCGEILDVDGRIGGFNFQWAWASGRMAGISATLAQGGGGGSSKV